MSDYYAHHRKVTARKRRRRAVIAVLVVLLLLLLAAAGAFLFLHPERAPAPLADLVRHVAPTAAPTAPPAAPTAEPTAEPATVGYTPRHLLPAVDSATWDFNVPVTQTIDFDYLNTDARMVAVPELGTVDLSFFDTVTFVGDSLTSGLGLQSYAALPNAHYAAYIGAGPQTILNNTQVQNAVTHVKEGALDAIVASAPDYVYLMFGTNSLVSRGNEAGFIAYYEAMIDKLREVLNPGVIYYVQAIPGVQEDVVRSKPGLDNARIQTVNNMLANMALRKGCYFINTQEPLCYADGSAIDEYSAGDGIHFKPVGYHAWRDYLATHTVWNRRSLYVGISPYYIYGR